MSDKKNEDLTLDATDDVVDFDVVDVVEGDVDLSLKNEETSNPVGSQPKDIPVVEDGVIEIKNEALVSGVDSLDDAVGVGGLDMEEDIVEAVVDVETDSFDSSDDDFDDFDDLGDELAAVSVASKSASKSGGNIKVVLGGLAVLCLAGAGGYYALSGNPQSAVPQVIPQPQVVVNTSVTADVDATVSSVVDDAPLFAGDVDTMFEDLPQPDVLAVVDDTVENVLVIDAAPEVSDANDVLVIDAAPVLMDDGVLAEDVSSDDMPMDAVVANTPMDDILPVNEPVDDVVVASSADAPVAIEPTVAQIVPVVEPIVELQQQVPQNIEPAKKPDVYFDSIAQIEQQENTLQEGGPSVLNPSLEPASKYLIVTDMKPKDSIESQIMQAKRALKLGRYDAAFDYYDRLYRRSPRDEAILMGRAVSLQKLGRENAAISAYEELLERHPKNADALVNMLGLVKGQYPAVALQKLLSIRNSNPRNAGVAAQIGLTYASMNNNLDARRYLNIAMGLEPNNALHSYNAAIVFDREGNRAKAVEYYEQALRIDAVHGGGRSVNRDAIYDRLSKIR